jgi:2-polyprenyl-3-methyl-5-hydroxy-6-metoxy-1,4-benzoquinol methylase
LFVSSDLITLSKGAIGDVLKEDNIVNGYLIDVRRSLFDMMTVAPSSLVKFSKWYEEDPEEVKKFVHEWGQFPFRERRSNYQSYFLKGEYVEGSRDTEYRFTEMKIPKDLTGKTVLDLGCCHGAMSIEAFRRGAHKVTGIDFQKEYIKCAENISRANGFQINFLRMDLTDVSGFAEFANGYYPDGVDIVFMLSEFKHFPDHFENIIRSFKWKILFVESNNAPEGEATGHVQKIREVLSRLSGVKVEALGKTTDRSPRFLYKVSHE